MRRLVVLSLLSAIYCIALGDTFQTHSATYAAPRSLIQTVSQSLHEWWHPVQSTENRIDDKFNESIAAYDNVSAAAKRKENGLSLLPGPWGSDNDISWASRTIELINSSWDWSIQSATQGQPWLVLFCGDHHKGCSQAYAEWENAYQLVGSYIHMGRVNVDAQRSIVSRYGIRSVPALYSTIDGKFQRISLPITAEAIYSFVRSSIPDVFKPIRTLDDWKLAFDWESTLKREGSNFPEKVKVVLFTDDVDIPLKWRYWGRQYAEYLIQWYVVNPSSVNTTLLEHLSQNFGISKAGIAMLFPNPRDHSEVIILTDTDTNGRSEALTSADLEDWLEMLAVPKLAKIDTFNFLHVVGNTHYTLAMAVDTSTGNTFGNSRIQRFNQLIDPVVALWEDRRGTNTRDLQFTWFEANKFSLTACFGFTKPPKDGSLLLIDRGRWEYAYLNVDPNDVSSVVKMIANYSRGKLPKKPFLCVPQSTDEGPSFLDSIRAAFGLG